MLHPNFLHEENTIMINAPHTNAIDIDIVAHAGLYTEISPRGGANLGYGQKS